MDAGRLRQRITVVRQIEHNLDAGHHRHGLARGQILQSPKRQLPIDRTIERQHQVAISNVE
jgi:hypothetical protein